MARTHVSTFIEHSTEDTTTTDEPPVASARADIPLHVQYARILVRHARFLIELFSDTIDRFSTIEGYRLVAAFSYYATFSIFPLLLLAISAIGFAVGDTAEARESVLAVFATAGSPARDVLDRTLGAMQAHGSARGITAIVGIATLFFSASGAFVELNAALNRIWCVPVRKSKGVLGSIRAYALERLSGFAIVACLGLTLLVSLVSSSVLVAVTDWTRQQVTMSSVLPALARTAEVVLTIALLTGVFTLAFHFIPRSRPRVRVVAPGALLTTVVLIALKEVFATFLSKLTSYSMYGVAGGVLALATWIYLSSFVIFLGAQLTRIHAEKLGVAEDCDQPKLLQLRSG